MHTTFSAALKMISKTRNKDAAQPPVRPVKRVHATRSSIALAADAASTPVPAVKRRALLAAPYGDASPTSIIITAGSVQLHAELNDSPTARKILAELPLNGVGTRWGGEIYFEIPVDSPEESNARVKMAVGDIGFWPPGNTFCVFFGLTPISMSDYPMAYSPVNVIGAVQGDATILSTVQDGAPMLIERVTK